MCGIAGYVDFSRKVGGNILRPMIDSIAYRGPDSWGEFHSKENIAHLGVRRLRIIDLKKGDQPIKSEDGEIVIVFNGEIYNYKELKKVLIRKGHRFKTESDTEVIVHGYEEFGESYIEKLNGMFTFAIWDNRNRKLILARDRVGIKPLYYFYNDDSLVFGSEPKTILKYPYFKKELNSESLELYFYFGFIPGYTSIYKSIEKVPPGHYLVFKDKKDKRALRKKYFELKTQETENNESLDGILENSVRRQLVSDVPVGVFLSGGLDSSLIAYYISKYKKLKSFSIGFSEPGFDESEHAHYVAKMIGTKHYSVEFGSKDVVPIFEKVVKNLDEPFSDASLIPTFKVNSLASEHVTVVLSGDGGDELFGGYPTYQAHILRNYLQFIPKFFLEKSSKIIDYFPEEFLNLIPLSFKDYSKKRLAKIVLESMRLENPERHWYLMRTFFLGDNLISKKPDLKKLTSILPKEKLGSAKEGQIIDLYTYLVDDFLVKADRASMYNSVEVRVPYLDNEVIDYAFTTKETHVNFLKTKIQLRRLLEKKLPNIAKRPKKGFGIPLEKWLRGDLKEFANSMLENRKIYNYLEKKKVDKLWKEHLDGSVNNSGAIWQLIIFSGWLNNWMS